MKLNVSGITRRIEIDADPEDAAAVVNWLREADQRVPGRPYGVSLLFGAFSAIAQNRGCGGH